jgi:hypothetical protein
MDIKERSGQAVEEAESGVKPGMTIPPHHPRIRRERLNGRKEVNNNPTVVGDKGPFREN